MRGIRCCSSSCSAPGTICDNQSGKATVITIEPDEKSPLLQWNYAARRESSNSDGANTSDSNTSSNNKPKVRFCEVRLVLFLLFLTTGFVIATYLLIAESRLPNMRFSLDLVHHDIWSNLAIPLSGLLNYSNVLNIIIKQTGGERCFELDTCLSLLRELQMQNLAETGNEPPYNFLIGSDGQAYEVRGWNYQSGFAIIPQNSSLVIGFIGDYTYAAPSAIQLRAALSLIKESKRRKKIQRQYKIYGLRNVTLSRTEGEALFQQVTKWPHFDTLLHVL